ncbi:Acg family FMN-binding oxidoreductase [Mycobacterium sp. NPDC003323]
MDATFPDRHTVETVLSLATRAPSIHNTQPWHWRVHADRLELHADPERALPQTDPDSRDLLLSCGATLHHAVIALAAHGWQAQVRRLPDPDQPGYLASVGVRRCAPAGSDVPLAAAIPRRRTDRRGYGAWAVSDADIALMGARTARAGVMLRQAQRLPELQRIVTEAVWRHATDREYLTELSTWSGRYGSLAGVPAHNTPKPDPAARIPARLFAGPVLAQPADGSGEHDGVAVLALGTKDDSALSRLRAGEATSLVLLTATTLGLASCPVTEPLEIAETRAAVRDDVFGDIGYPQMLLRVGWAPVNADPLPATPRLPLSAVVDWPAQLG